MSRIAVPVAALEAAREAIAGLPVIGPGLAGLSRPVHRLSDAQGACLDPARLGFDRTTFTRTLATALPGLPDAPAEALWALRTQKPAQRAAIQVILDRALDPLAGLATYPDDALFTAEEQAVLQKLDAEPAAPSPPPRGAVTGIVKVTRHCNLRCTYCHDWRVGRDAAMPFEVLARAMKWLCGSGARTVNVVLHGGEPSLIGPTGMIRLLALQARYRTAGARVVTRMQTNGARLTDDMIDVLLRFGVRASVSLDGPPEVHDRTRVTVAGDGSSARARDAIRRLRADGVLNGVIMVVTPALIACGAERLVAWLAEEEITGIALLAMRPAAGTPPARGDSLPTADYCAFLLEVEHWRRSHHPELAVREIDAVQAALAGGPAGTCELQGFCVGHYFAIEPDGSVSHCDKYVGDPAYVLGNVRETFSAVVESAAARRIAARATAALDRKRGCGWWSACRGWCPHESYVADQLGEAGDCCGLAPLFEALSRADGAHEARRADGR